MLFQPYKSDFILAMIKEVEALEARCHCTVMKKSEVNNKYNNKYEKLKTILSILSFKNKRFPDRILTKYKSRLFVHLGMQQLGVKY